MSAITTLQQADATLAAQLDRVTESIASVGSKTVVARDRLAQALADARGRLGELLAEVADMVAGTVETFDAVASCDLLAVPEPEPDVVVQVTEPEPIAPVLTEIVRMLDDEYAEREAAPINRATLSESMAKEGLTSVGYDLAVNRVAALTPAQEKIIQTLDTEHAAREEAAAIDASDAKEDAEAIEKHRSNGKPKRKRR